MKLTSFLKTIRGRIIAITTGITLLIACITVLICFTVFQSFLKRNQIQSSEYNLQVVANNVSSDMKDIIYFSSWCRSNQDMLNYVEAFRDKKGLAAASKEDKTLKQLALNSYDRLKEEYYNTRHSNYITRVIVSNNTASNYLQIMATSSESSTYQVSSFPTSRLFIRLASQPQLTWEGLAADPFQPRSTNKKILPIIRPIYSKYSSDVTGWVYLSISPDIITDYLNTIPLPEDSQLYLTIGEGFYLIQNGQLMEAEPDYQVLEDLSKNSLDEETVVQKIKLSSGASRTLVTRSLGEPGWYIHQILSKQQLDQQNQVYLLLICIICLVIFSLGLTLLVILNRTINRPVAMVQKKIDEIAQGDFSRDPSIEWNHEIGDIGHGINHLSEEVVNLMDKRIADEKQKKDLEYQILQSQINPHFLYNTLNSIKWMATIQGASGIAEMTTALARLMKNVAKGTTALITLKEELDLVKDYFLIQQYRYGGSITIDYQIESDELYQCMVHRFSLQPIIENALFHGIEPKGSAGKIVVDVHRCPDDLRNLLISITDNGIGMSPETIERVLNNPDANTKADFFKQVGISNVNRRIKYDFGPDYGISIESEPGEYTTMKLLIPCITESEGVKENV